MKARDVRWWATAWVATAVCAGPLAVVGAPTVDSVGSLVERVNGAWTNDCVARAVPPAPVIYNRDLGIVGYATGFDTNFLAGLSIVTNGTVATRPLLVLETNTTPRARVFYGADGTPVHTASVDITDYPESWIVDVYGSPPPWLNGNNLSTWYSLRDPARQRVHLTLISTSDVPAYIASLTNAIGASGAGTNAVPLLDLYSNHIAFVGLSVSTQALSLYVHAPQDIARIDLFDSTNLTTIAGGWWLAGTLDYEVDPILWSGAPAASNAFYSAGDADADTDGDGLSDIRELRLYGTNPTKRDSDDDGLSDGEEVLTYDLDPLDDDSDDDGLTDGWEVFSAVNPFDVDVQTTVPVCLRFGDTNGTSGSEIYCLTASTAGWWLSVTNPAYGVESVVNTNYHRGSVYTQALTHVATDPSWEKGTDYDYHFLIDNPSDSRGWTWTDHYVIADTNTTYDEQHPGDDEPTGGVDIGQGILGNHWENNKTWWFDATNGTGEVLVYVPLVDLDPANASNVVADAWIGEGAAPGTVMAVGTGSLRRVRFTRGPETMPTGTVTLAIASGANRIRVWRDPAMGAGDLLLSADNSTTNWVLAGASTWTAIPTNVWVEGVTNSASAGDIALAARYSGPSGVLCADTNLFTIIEVRSVELLGAPTNGLVVKSGETVTMKASILPSAYTPPMGQPAWYCQQLNADGSWGTWTSFGSGASGVTYTHPTATGGIFRVKAVLTDGGVICERTFARTADDAYSTLLAGDLDAFGVVDTDMQRTLRNTAMAELGSTYYSAAGSLPLWRDPTGLFSGVSKCNVFVADMCDSAGADVDPPVAGVYLSGPHSANQWAGMPDVGDPSAPYPIPDWTLLAEDTKPQPGHVAASGFETGASGHCGIVDYDGQWISGGSANVNRKAEFASYVRIYISGTNKPAGQQVYDP